MDKNKKPVVNNKTLSRINQEDMDSPVLLGYIERVFSGQGTKYLLIILALIFGMVFGTLVLSVSAVIVFLKIIVVAGIV